MAATVGALGDLGVGELLAFFGVAVALLTLVLVSGIWILPSYSLPSSTRRALAMASTVRSASIAGQRPVHLGRRSARRRGPGPGGYALGDREADRAGPTEGEVRDVERVLAEDGADAADDSGDVVVADGDERAEERRLDVDAVVGEEAGRGAVEHGGRGAGISVGGVKGELEDGAGAAGDELALVFLDADAAFGGNGRRR